MASANVTVTLPEISAALRAKLARADEAIRDYEAMQHIIILLLERLGGSATLSDEALVTVRQGVGITRVRDEATGAWTFSLGTTQAARAA